MEEENKLPLKRVELSLTKFNEVAIPHHLDLLRQHKANIIKYEEAEEYGRVRSEQVHARRVAAQLRALLGEMDALRRQVRAQDVPHFDRLTQRSRDLTLRAIMDYLGVIERSCIALVRSAQTRSRCSGENSFQELGSSFLYIIESSPMSIPARAAPTPPGSARSAESVGVLEPAPLVQLHVDPQELQLREREAVLRGWGELQAEVRALHDAWQHVQAAALAQREQVGAVVSSVDVGADNVQAAREHLALGERLRAGAWGAGPWGWCWAPRRARPRCWWAPRSATWARACWAGGATRSSAPTPPPTPTPSGSSCSRAAGGRLSLSHKPLPTSASRNGFPRHAFDSSLSSFSYSLVP